MIPAHRLEAVLSEDGKLSLNHLPFLTGQTVEVIILPVDTTTDEKHTLHGSVLNYERPTDPVDESDWDVFK